MSNTIGKSTVYIGKSIAGSLKKCRVYPFMVGFRGFGVQGSGFLVLV